MNTKPILIAGAVLALVGAFVLKESGRRTAAVESASSEAQPTAAPLPRLIDLGADKCIPCKKMAPILEELSSTYEDVFVVEFVDVWKDPAAAKPWGLRVIPTQVFLDASGTEKFRHEGFMAREAILDTWRNLGFEFPDRPEPAGS